MQDIFFFELDCLLRTDHIVGLDYLNSGDRNTCISIGNSNSEFINIQYFSILYITYTGKRK